jgi:ribose transport system substrate-binding protein
MRTLSGSRKWRLGAVLIGLVAALALSACSSKKEGSSTSASSSSSGGSSSGCKASATGKAQYDKVWRATEQTFGLDQSSSIPSIQICDVDTTKYKKSPTNGKYRIALAAQGPTNSWAVENEEAFKYRAQQENVDELYASANGDASKQVDNIQQLTSQKPDAMVVVPMGSGITGQVKAAAAQGIPVVLCSGVLGPDSGAVSTVTRDYTLQGTLWADWIAKQIGGKGRIAMLSGIAGVPTAEFPKAAAEKEFATKYPNIKIVSKQYTDWSPTKAKTVAASLVPKHLDAIWSDSSFSAMGVYEAYTQAGKPVPPVTGDASNAFLKAVKGKDVKFALSPFPPDGQGAQCLDVALDILHGKSVPSFINVEAPAITNENMDQYVRTDCTDNLWVPPTLPDAVLRKLKLC